MKTFIDSLIEQFAAATHPAGGWLKTPATEKKSNNDKGMPTVVLSPDCYAIRGGSAKKSTNRRTPAP